MRLQRIIMLVLLVAGCFSMMSCLSAVEEDRVVYDAAKDEYRFLMVLRNIRGDSAGDADKLKQFWDRREKLLAPVFPGYPSWLMVMSDHEVQRVGFGGDPEKVPTKAEGSLNSIRIVPGSFFVDGGQLCYYHEMIIPGKFIDEELKQLQKEQLKRLTKELDVEIKRRAGGGARVSWEALKADAVSSLKGDVTPVQPEAGKPGTGKPKTGVPADATDYSALDDESLKELKAGGAAFARKGDAIVAQWPLVDADRVGVLDMWQAMRDAAAARLKEKPDDYFAVLLNAASRAVDLQKSDKGISAAVHLPALETEISHAMTTIMPKQSDAKGYDLEGYANEHSMLKDGLTREGVVKDFAAGALK